MESRHPPGARPWAISAGLTRACLESPRPRSSTPGEREIGKYRFNISKYRLNIGTPGSAEIARLQSKLDAALVAKDYAQATGLQAQMKEIKRLQSELAAALAAQDYEQAAAHIHRSGCKFRIYSCGGKQLLINNN